MGSLGLYIGHISMPSNICCVVVEYLAGGALKSYVIKCRRKKLAFKVVVLIALDLARGLSYLHNPDKRPEMDEVVAMMEAMIPVDQQQGCLCFCTKRGP